jgi:hypothetical protein
MVRSFGSLFTEDEGILGDADVESIMPTGTIDDELKELLKHERTWPEAAELMAARSPGDAACVSDFSLHCITFHTAPPPSPPHNFFTFPFSDDAL